MGTIATTTIAACISAAASIIVAVIFYNRNIKKIQEDTKSLLGKEDQNYRDLSKEHGSLSKEHGSLSKEHGSLSKEHVILLERSKTTQDAVSSFMEKEAEERSKEQFRYDNLTEKQRDIVNTVTNVQAMANEIKYLVTQNKELLVKLEQSKEETKELRAELREIKETRREREPDRDMER